MLKNYTLTLMPSLRALPLLLLLVGCVSGYKQFYRPEPDATPEAVSAQRLNPPPAMPIIERAKHTDPQIISDSYGKRGYSVIGSSFFNSGESEPEGSAIQQAKDVKADLVLILNPRYTGSITTAVPIITPTTTTSRSSGTATAYGQDGSVTAYGSGTTITHGTTTNYVPVTVDRSEFGAVFFIKRRFGLGASVRDLNDGERQDLQTNKGATIELVVDDTPAFNSDILVGDIVTMLDGIPITGAQHLLSLISEKKGRMVSISIHRHGQRLEKSVQLNP